MKKALRLTTAQRRELRARVEADIASTTDEEDAEIHAAAMTDPDNPPTYLPEAERRALRAKLLAEQPPETPGRIVSMSVPGQIPARLRRGGRPRSEVTKLPITLRLDRDVVARFRATGEGWQTRMNEALRKAAARL